MLFISTATTDRMNTKILLMRAGATICFITLAASAHAQSSVTMYGLLDASVGFVKTNSGNEFGQFSGGMHGDRWGIKGSEDLGDGLSAVFQLENGFNIATGQLKQNGRLFGRQAYVGLNGSSFGAVTLGRQYDPIVDLVQGQTADPIYGGTFGTPGDIDNYDNTVRVDNSVKYRSPNIGGVTVEALYAFSGVPGQAGEGLTWSAGARYAMGNTALAAGYFYSSNVAGMRSTWASPTADSFFSSPINDGYSTAHAVGIARASGSYILDKVTLGASYSNIQLMRDASSTFAENEHYNAANIFVSYKATPRTSIGFGYTFTRANGDTSATYNQLNAGILYGLSTRTSLYTLVGYQHASGEQRTSSGGIRAAEASIGSFGVAGGSTQELAIVGILHRF